MSRVSLDSKEDVILPSLCRTSSCEDQDDCLTIVWLPRIYPVPSIEQSDELEDER
jgi:hypothetical protein